MTIRFAAFALTIAALAACASTPPGPPQLEAVWTAIGFDEPESVILSAENDFLYVSSVAGEGDERDGEGYISKVSLEGVVLERRWAEGLDGPKGMALDGAGLLWVSDINRLVALDAETGQLRESHVIGPARFLNDAARLPDGTIIVADSGTGTIFSKTASGHSTWLKDDLLESANGLLPQEERLLVTTMEGSLLAVDYATKQIGVLVEGLGQADGVAELRRGDLIVTHWPGRIVHIGADGIAATIMDTEEAGIYQNDLIHIGRNVIVVPNWQPGTLSAWKVKK